MIEKDLLSFSSAGMRIYENKKRLDVFGVVIRMNERRAKTAERVIEIVRFGLPHKHVDSILPFAYCFMVLFVVFIFIVDILLFSFKQFSFKINFSMFSLGFDKIL